MAYFRCSTIGGGDGADLIVTCDSDFSGAIITCTDGTKTFTQTCPSSSPYTVTFESIPTGTWTISGVVSGQTYYAYKTITDFTETLKAIPDGATKTPTDDIQIWLNCANIWDKTTYTTISDVLADTTTLLALISDSNAVDYMARSTTWASSVCANSTAMTYIGANNYCADTLLSDNTWLNAISNSTYFESVLNVKVPTMTSNTTPSGVCTADSSSSGASAPYTSFDGVLTSTSASYGAPAPNNSYTSHWGYEFDSMCKIWKANIYLWGGTNYSFTYKIQGYYDSSWVDIASGSGTTTANSVKTFNTVCSPISNCEKFRLEISSSTKLSISGQYATHLAELQLYGRSA